MVRIVSILKEGAQTNLFRVFRSRIGRFLSLSGNRIEKIGNLNFLQNLMLLDLSHNLIQYLSVGELPTNLFILDLTENSCTQKYGYRQQILESLPLLQELDREPVRERESLEEHPVMQEDDEEIDIDNVFSPTSIVSESLYSLHEELVERSYQRRERARREHQERLEELREIPIKDTMQQYNCSSLHEIGPRATALSKKEPQSPALYKSPLLLTKHRQVLAPSEKKIDNLNCHNASTSSKVITVKTPTKALATPPQTQYGAPRSRNMSKSAFSSSPSCKLSPTQPSALTTPSSKLQTSASVQGKRTAKMAPLSGKSQPTASSTSQHAGKFSSRQLKKQTQ
ncbi:leucine-rich repeat-containing protein 46 [Bombina bombina]|uniref:leucine-rich repeat-containing protein 46 n=1 Tax=Bombina bombina TaxID=8345 RepID=UPI00235ACB47|nr:leucine-rich repeat-containing protein 46 [Bombina bombina]